MRVGGGGTSTSALSTATAVCALAMVLRHDHENFYPAEEKQRFRMLLERGIDWLIRNRNADGGWGDTIISHSNLSTTLLCWAVLEFTEHHSEAWQEALANARSWITETAGGTEPEIITSCILRKYGRDQTFSIPILTHCALAGKLGEFPQAWHSIKQLPFELAACPHAWFSALRLPVVSYALPALIAIGLVRHYHYPSANPITRLLRNLVKNRTLDKLSSIQPGSGGFLEAVPLTSFVSMSLAASVGVDHEVVRRGIRFLCDSVRPDGSWAIDSNLATWVTTLSINALGSDDDFPEEWSVVERQRLLDYLLAQQYQSIHPYTATPPGGWAWTHLPGGVPDADDTSGALLALHHLQLNDARILPAAELAMAGCSSYKMRMEAYQPSAGDGPTCLSTASCPISPHMR